MVHGRTRWWTSAGALLIIGVLLGLAIPESARAAAGDDVILQRAMTSLERSATGRSIAAAMRARGVHIEISDTYIDEHCTGAGGCYAGTASTIYFAGRLRTAQPDNFAALLAHEATHMMDDSFWPVMYRQHAGEAAIWSETRAYMVGAQVAKDLGGLTSAVGGLSGGVLESPEATAAKVRVHPLYTERYHLAARTPALNIPITLGDPLITRIVLGWNRWRLPVSSTLRMIPTGYQGEAYPVTTSTYLPTSLWSPTGYTNSGIWAGQRVYAYGSSTASGWMYESVHTGWHWGARAGLAVYACDRRPSNPWVNPVRAGSLLWHVNAAQAPRMTVSIAARVIVDCANGFRDARGSGATLMSVQVQEPGSTAWTSGYLDVRSLGS